MITKKIHEEQLIELKILQLREEKTWEGRNESESYNVKEVNYTTRYSLEGGT